MSNKKKQPKSNAFSMPNIFFYMVGFVIMVQNPLWINLIILSCSVMFLLPLGLAKRLNGFIHAKDLLIKQQGFIHQWYKKNVPEDEKASPTVIPTKQQIVSEENALEQNSCDFNTIPEPPEHHDSYDEVWANYHNEEHQ